MLNKKLLFLFLTLFIRTTSWAQSERGTTISFIPLFQQEQLCLNTTVTLTSEEEIFIEKLQLYISQVVFYQGDDLVYAEENSFHLLDAAKPASLSILLDTPADLKFSSLQFNLGLDSLTNVSGAQGGALDPSQGMYWTWKSGYINLKLEGTAAHCPARNQRFQFHLGGYQAPANSLQQINLPVSKSGNVMIQISIDEFLATLDLAQQYQVMSPSQEAVALAQQFAAVFKVVE